MTRGAVRARARAGVLACPVMRRALLLGLLSAPLACGDAGSSIEPMTGTWVFVNGEVITNTCADEAEPGSGDFTLLNNGDGTFTIDPEDGSEAFLCTLDGADFTCPKRLQETVPVDGVDATIQIRVSAIGTLSSPRAAKGQQDAVVECTGSACGTVASLAGVTFPCEVSANYTASFKE